MGSNLDLSASRVLRILLISSPLLFLQAYTEYYSITIETDTLHDFLLCESESLLKRIYGAITCSLVNPSHCIASDYHLEQSGILDIIAKIGISFNYLLHVKGHQDDDTDIHLLPWTAQMNVQVETLATGYLDKLLRTIQICPFHSSLQSQPHYLG